MEVKGERTKASKEAASCQLYSEVATGLELTSELILLSSLWAFTIIWLLIINTNRLLRASRASVGLSWKHMERISLSEHLRA